MDQPPLPMPGHWDPWYRDMTFLAGYLADRNVHDIVVQPPSRLRADYGGMAALLTDDPEPEQLMLTKRRAYAPAPFTGDPFMYMWAYATDGVGRSIASDCWPEYLDPVGYEIERERAWVRRGRPC